MSGVAGALALPVILLCGELQAQNAPGTIRGVVVDKERGAPVSGARVRLLGTSVSTETNSEGYFVLSGLEPGRYTVEVRADGFVTEFDAGIFVASGGFEDRRITLSPSYTDLGEFKYEGEIDLAAGSEEALLLEKFDSKGLIDSIGSDLIGQSGASGADDALRLIPGATVSNDGFAVIRGLPDRFVSVQLNGVRLPSSDAETRSVELDQFPSTVIESVQVSKTFSPEQQSDASGGAVNLILKTVPDEPFFVRFSSSLGYNSQVQRRVDFLTYEGGGVSTFGYDNRRRNQQPTPGDGTGAIWSGALGTSRGQAPVDFSYSLVVGGGYDLNRDWRVGGAVSYFYSRDTSFQNDAFDDQWWIAPGTSALEPARSNVNGASNFITSLLDIQQGSQQVQWGTLATAGIKSENNELSFTFLLTRSAEDTATIAEDTRGRQFFFPGYDPNDPSSPGFGNIESAPLLRRETLAYEERQLTSGQLHGEHTLDFAEFGIFKAPKIDWTLSLNRSESNEPDRRQLSNTFQDPLVFNGVELVPASQAALPPSATASLGPLQRIFERVEEESEQLSVNFTLPFEQWTGDEGAIRFGYFNDQVDRDYNQDTFSNAGFDPFPTVLGGFDTFYSSVYPFLGVPVSGIGPSGAGAIDVDYTGVQEIEAFYVVADLPLTSNLTLSGGVRFEDSSISTDVTGEEFAIAFLPGAAAGSFFGDLADPTIANADQSNTNTLPSVSLRYDPTDDLTLRAAYSETVARQTFRELAPVLQQEFIGGPIFVGFPGLQQSEVTNYDLRADYRPYEGGLVSASWFLKDLSNPIETFENQIGGANFTTAGNFPDGEIQGVELEVRQDLGVVWDQLEGLSFGANATFLRTSVTVSQTQIEDFEVQGLEIPALTRDATGAPEFLYNLYSTYSVPFLETQIGLFYTVTGDTLVSGFGFNRGNLVPNVYQAEFGTLNLTVTQPLGDYVQLSFKASNLTNPDIEQVYRDDLIDGDFTRASFSRGIDYSFGISAQFDV
ncbi:MAG: TonB-dependent receptor [Planctomycetota bacterium]